MVTVLPRKIVLCLCLFFISLDTVSAKEFALQVKNAVLEVSLPERASAAEQRKISHWLQHSALAVTQAYGRFPLQRARVKISYYKLRNEPVPWASVIRSGIQGVHFYINPKFSLQEFLSDWTAYHEFSHLLMPYPGRSGIWMSEGLASYYQNVLQARSGMLTQQGALQKLVNGFVRGEKDRNAAGLSLRKLSLEMKKRRSFMRVYWAGAAYFLNVDVALRTESMHKQSLDSVLKEFGACCLLSDRRWSDRELAEQFDRISKTNIFSKFYQEIIDDKDFPQYQFALAVLGVRVDGTEVILSQEKAQRRIRAAIFDPR